MDNISIEALYIYILTIHRTKIPVKLNWAESMQTVCINALIPVCFYSNTQRITDRGYGQHASAFTPVRFHSNTQ